MIVLWPTAPLPKIIKRKVTRFARRPLRAPFGLSPQARLHFMLAIAFIPALIAAPLAAQSPHSIVNSEAFGFSYHLPPDWQIAADESTLPAAKQDAEQSAKNPSQVLSVACAQVVLSAQHGKPPSVIVVTALPFSCYGQPMAAKDLSHFAAGVSDGLRQNLNVSNPVYGAYRLGTHNFWIERAVGIPKNHAGPEYTLEIVCSVLRKSAVCWMTLAESAGALRDFENGIVALDGEPPVVLVPINAFVKNPLLNQP